MLLIDCVFIGIIFRELSHKMVDRSFYGFKSDFEESGQPVYARHVNTALGIDVSYAKFDERKYTRDFASAKEAREYLRKHPPAYTRDDKKDFLDTLDKYKTLDYEKFTALKVEEEELSHDSQKSTLSYKIPFTLGLRELPGQVANEPFYFVQEIESIILKHSKIIREIMLALKPMIIPPPDKRYKVTGEYLEVIFKEIGVFVNEKSISETNDIWVLHCKMDEIGDGVEDKMNNETTEMDRRQAEFRGETGDKYMRNCHDIPILKEATKELSIDRDDPESIESYVQEDMGLRIILKEINRDRNKKDNNLAKRIFIFNCFFFV